MTPAEAKQLEELDKYVKANNVGYSERGLKERGRRDAEGSPEGVVHNPGDMVGLHASTEIFVKDVADILTKKFPGFRWAIQPNEVGGVLNIFCLDFHSVWGYVVRYDDIMNDPKRRQAIIAARTLLKRFRYPGTVYKPELMAAIKRTGDGSAIPDVGDMAPTRFTKKAELEYKLATGDARVVGTASKGRIIEVRK
jgi:hypothetical protein